MPLCLCCCCCCSMCCILPQRKGFFSSKRGPNIKYLYSKEFNSTQNWMQSLSDDICVSEINLVGTHDSLSLFPYYGLQVSVCQRWILLDQLNSGIRLLDIRVKEDLDGKLPLHHSQSFQHCYLEKDVIDVIDQFLIKNPSEFVILMIRIEDQEAGAPSLAQGFDKIVRKKRQNLFSFESWIPNLDKLRGKIWIWPGNNWDYKGYSMKQKIRTGQLIRQDFYDCSVEEKKKIIKEVNNMAYQNKSLRQSGQEIYLNQMNGVKWYCWPSSYAEQINQYVYDNQLYEGFLVFDFPGEKIIKEVIESNFYQPKEYFTKDYESIN
ncbi:hypothetical protein ABPG72_013797 [Tetrahymena utriculariae]